MDSRFSVRVTKVVVEARNPGLRSEGPFSRREEGWELGEEKEKKKVKEKEKKGAWRVPADLHPPAIKVFTGRE